MAGLTKLKKALNKALKDYMGLVESETPRYHLRK